MRASLLTQTTLAAGLALILSTSCSLGIHQRKPSPSVSKDLAVKPDQVRLRMRSLVEPFTGEIEQSADQIAAATLDVSVKRAAIRWKIEGVPALRGTLFQPDPFTAVFDTWVLTYQMSNYFDTGPGRMELGASAPHAVDTCLRMEEELNQIVSTFAISGDVTKFRQGAKKWATDHPIRYAIRDRETTLSRVTEQDVGVDWSAGEVIAELATTADDIHREIQIYSDHLFRQARWEAELLKLDLHASEVFPLAERAVKSSERAVESLDNLTPTIKTAADAAATAADAATKAVSDVPTIVSSERKAAVDAITQDLRETFAFAQGERIASLEYISRERATALQQVTQERIAAIEELRIIANNERMAFSRDIEQAGLRIVDHAAWRLAQLVAVALGFLFLAALLFLFIVRKLFFTPRQAQPWFAQSLRRGA